MKILFIDTEPIMRGAQVFISELSLFLDHQGQQTKIVYLYQIENNSDDSILSSPNTTVLTGKKQSALEKLPGIDPVLLRKLLIEINTFSPDIILANGSRTLKYVAVARQFYKTNTKWIARWIDDAAFWNPGFLSKWIYSKLIMPQFDATVGVSQASLDSMIRHYDFKKSSTVIHRVFDPLKFNNAPTREEARRKLGLDDTDEVLLFLGNLTSQKRPDRFLEIVQKLSQTRPNLKALIVGDGPLRKELEKEVLSIKYQASSKEIQEQRFKNQDSKKSNVLSLDTNVSFFGYHQDVSPYLASADILVLTSDTEGLPGVVLEAANFEVPTVATEVGGIRECLIDGETGFLIPDRSVDSFCEKINQLLDQPNQRIQLGQNAKKFTSQHFRMDQVAQQYLDFFQQIINQS